MNRENAIQEVGRPFLKPIGIIQIMAILAVISSVFIFIWDDWVFAIKLGLSGVVVILLCYFLSRFVERVVGEAIDEKIKEINSEGKGVDYKERIKDVVKKVKK